MVRDFESSLVFNLIFKILETCILEIKVGKIAEGI